MLKKILSSTLMFLLIGQVSFIFAKNSDEAEEKAAEIRKQATELLRETSALAVMLNSPSNRINFTVSTADTLWNLDKAEATSMFGIAIEDVRKMISQIDSEMNFSSSTSSTIGSGRNSRNANYNKINQVISWRASIVNSLSNRDAEWAMRFLNETTQTITNPNLKKRIEQSNRGLNATLARKIAEQDVTKAIAFGKERLSNGLSNDVINIMQKIYDKDPDKGVEFGNEVLKKLNTIKLNRNSMWMAIRLFQYGLRSTENSAKTNNKPLFDDSSMKDLADKLVESITNPTNRYRSVTSDVMKGLEKYSPQGAAQLKNVLEQRKNAVNVRTTPTGRISTSPKTSSNVKKQSDSLNQIRTLIQSLNSNNQTADEKSKIIDDAKNIIMYMENTDLRFSNLIWLASTAKRVDQEDKAADILKDAEGFVNQDPKMRNEYSQNRSLAEAYANIDADKTFQILENMAYRLNGVIDGYIRFMEYSNNQRIVENGELVMNNSSNQFTSYFNLSPIALKSLAEEDFNRVKDLSDKFERPEVRIATRLIIAKSLLNTSRQNSTVFSAGLTRIEAID